MIKRWAVTAWLMVFITAALVTACGGGGSASSDGSGGVNTGAPSAPTGVSATATSASQVNINWTLDANATSYHIYRSAAPNVAITPANLLAATAASPYSNTGLPAATTYYYKVTAVNANGESAGSAEVSAATLAGAPVLLGGAIQGNSLALTTAVTTFAGTAGVPGAVNGTGAAASFNLPASVTTDGANLYIADTTNSVVRKIVISTGAVTTLAGTAGVTGAVDATGAAASFSSPQGITTDGTNLYVVDSGGNNTIRQINITTGVVTTLAGAAGVIGAADGTGAAASFNGPKGITTDGTNLYVTDLGNQAIRKIVIATGAVTTLAGTAGVAGYADGTGTAALFFGPADITTDGTNLYVADYNNYVIRKIVIASGAVTTLAGTAGTWGSAGGMGGPVDGTGAAATFCFPQGITTDGTNLYVTDMGSQTIRKIVIATKTVTTLAGSYVSAGGMPNTSGVGGSANGMGAGASFNSPQGITTDGISLFIADQNNSTIRKMQ